MEFLSEAGCLQEAILEVVSLTHQSLFWATKKFIVLYTVVLQEGNVKGKYHILENMTKKLEMGDTGWKVCKKIWFIQQQRFLLGSSMQNFNFGPFFLMSSS